VAEATVASCGQAARDRWHAVSGGGMSPVGIGAYMNLYKHLMTDATWM